MLSEIVRKPNPETNTLISYGANNTMNYKPIETD